MGAVPSIRELWPVRNGYLLPASLDLDVRDPHHRDALRVGVDLLAAIPRSHSVRLAGSAAVRERHAPMPRDLDLALLVRDPADVAAARSRVRAWVGRWQRRGFLPLDIVAVPVTMLLDDPFVHLPTAFQSVHVCGEPLPQAGFALAADWSTASVLWTGRYREARAMLRTLYRGLEADDAPPAAIADLVQRIQKRILRLVAPVALAQLQVYTTDLRRCAALLARLEPAAACVARSVLDDLERDDTSIEAIDRVTDLSMQVFGLDDRVRAKHDVAQPDRPARWRRIALCEPRT